MSHPASIEPLPPEVQRQAAEWVVELQSEGVTAETRQRWQQWRASSPDHEHAWQRIESFGIKLRGLPSAIAHAALAPGSAQRRQLIKALTVLLFVGGTTSWVVQEKALLRHWVADRRTGTGARADLTLPDGTRVQLNTRTAVDIRFSASERVLRLLDGEILITTGHDRVAEPAATYRPLIVQTAQGRIRALGTRFSVREVEEDAGDTTRVAVYEGAVEIRPKDAVSGPLVLQAGEQGRFTRTAAELVGPADRDSTAWTQGMIIAQDMPLANFLAEIDRHRPGRLACDPAIAQLRVSGTYPLADTERVLDMLVTVLPVQVRFITRYWVTVQSSR